MKRVPGAIVKVARVMNRRVELQTEVDISAKTAAAPPRPSGSLTVWPSPSVFNFSLKIIFFPLPALIIYFSVSARLEINGRRSGVESEVMELRWIGVFVSTGSRQLPLRPWSLIYVAYNYFWPPVIFISHHRCSY